MGDNNYHINYFGSHIPFNPDNLPETNYVTGQGSKRPVGLTVREICELYWTVKSFNVNINVIDLNIDPLTTFLSTGGGAGGILGAIGGLASVANSLASSILAGIKGRTNVFSAYQRKNRKCKITGADDDFKYDNFGNIIGIKNCKSIVVEKEFVAIDTDTDESRLCVAGPIHSISSANGQGYLQINFTDIIYSNRLYWPIIILTIGNGEFVVTSDIMSLGANQNNYNIGAINFCNMGTIKMSGYSIKSLQPIFYSVNGDVRIGERCCDRFYFDGVDRNSAEDPCFQECKKSTQTTARPQSLVERILKQIKDAGGSVGRFVGGGGDSGGGGAGGSW
jgi:hypothetical protein